MRSFVQDQASYFFIFCFLTQAQGFFLDFVYMFLLAFTSVKINSDVKARFMFAFGFLHSYSWWNFWFCFCVFVCVCVLWFFGCVCLFWCFFLCLHSLGGYSNWKPPVQCKLYNYLKRIGCFFLHPRCGTRREAADFALCLHVSQCTLSFLLHFCTQKRVT